jgi:hypothetical protein
MDELKIAAAIILAKMMETDPGLSKRGFSTPFPKSGGGEPTRTFDLKVLAARYWETLKALQEETPR